jgi:AcrR family transcriptional regulator
MAEAVDQKRRRLGGRRARVQDAVLKSVFELLIEKVREHFTVTEVAARAGLHEGPHGRNLTNGGRYRETEWS